MENSKDILLALGRLEGKVESLLTMQRDTSNHVNTLERRLRSLEQGKSYMMGAAGAVGALTSAAISWIIK